MKLLVMAGFVMLLAAGCAGEPAFKGMELYSWKPEGQDWHFSLLLGTNREKELAEITSPESTIRGVGNLKKRLSRLAEGESILWRNLAAESIREKTRAEGEPVFLRNLATEPVPENTQAELKAYCQERHIELHLPSDPP